MSGESSFEEIVHKLALEYARIAHLGWKRIMAEQQDTYHTIREVGASLNEVGGYAAMRDATLEVFALSEERFPTAVDFNRLWDGIGAWRA